jgi:hypothetical protein
MNQFTPAPEYPIRTVSNLLRKFVKIFASQGAPPVATTPAANLPPVLQVLLILWQFATSVNETGGKYWEEYQAAET